MNQNAAQLVQLMNNQRPKKFMQTLLKEIEINTSAIESFFFPSGTKIGGDTFLEFIKLKSVSFQEDSTLEKFFRILNNRAQDYYNACSRC